jgi:hypothetical protein
VGIEVDPTDTRLVVTTCSATSDYLVGRLDAAGAASRLASTRPTNTASSATALVAATSSPNSPSNRVETR